MLSIWLSLGEQRKIIRFFWLRVVSKFAFRLVVTLTTTITITTVLVCVRIGIESDRVGKSRNQHNITKEHVTFPKG